MPLADGAVDCGHETGEFALALRWGTLVTVVDFDKAVGMLRPRLRGGSSRFFVLPELAVAKALCGTLGASIVRETPIFLPRRLVIILFPEVKAFRSCAISVIFEELEDFLKGFD